METKKRLNVSLRLKTSEEVRELAKKTGLGVAGVVYEALDHYKKRVVFLGDGREEIVKAVDNLRRVGVLLNQAVYALHKYGLVGKKERERYLQALEEVLGVVSELKRELEGFQGVIQIHLINRLCRSYMELRDDREDKKSG